jgi:hypothetical protein
MEQPKRAKKHDNSCSACTRSVDPTPITQAIFASGSRSQDNIKLAPATTATTTQNPPTLLTCWRRRHNPFRQFPSPSLASFSSSTCWSLKMHAWIMSSMFPPKKSGSG